MKMIVEGLRKSFDKNSVLDDVNFEIESGDIVAIVGRNGSGKTTLMQTMVNIFNKDSGKVFIKYDDEDLKINKSMKNNKIDLDDAPEFLKDIIYVPEKFDYFKNYNISKIMRFYETMYPNFDKEYCIDRISKLDIDIDKNMISLSKGQLTLVATIVGISTGAAFMLIDEPYDGIDVINSKLMDKLIIEASEKNRG